MNLFSELQAYQPEKGGEVLMHQRFLTFMQNHNDCFERSLLVGHITASALVIDLKLGKVLLLHHKKLNRWLQPGGHCDGNKNTLDVAQNEVMEETGLVFKMAEAPVFDLDIHEIPEHKDIPAHFHYDVRYLFDTDATIRLVQNHETNELKWVDIADVQSYTKDESILRMIRKVNRRMESA